MFSLRAARGYFQAFVYLIFATSITVAQPVLAQASGGSCSLPSYTGPMHTVTVTPQLLLGQFAGSVGASASWVPHTSEIIFSSGGSIDVLDTQTRACHTVVPGSGPMPSPDGRQIAYFGAGRQLYIVGMDGSNPRAISNIPGGMPALNGLAWAPDSRRFAFAYQASKTNQEIKFPKLSPTTPTVIEVGAPTSAPPDGVVQVVDTSTGTLTTVTSGPYSPGSLSWIGNHLIYAAAHFGSEYNNGKWWAEVRSIDVNTRKQTVLVANHGVQHLEPIASPLGNAVAFADDPNNVYYPYNLNVATVSLSSKQIRMWTTNTSFPHSVRGDIHWAPDGHSLYFLGKTDIFSHIYRVDPSGKITQIDKGNANAGGYDFSSDGKKLLWSASDAYGHAQIIVGNLDGSNSHVLLKMHPQVNALRFGTATVVQYRSPDGVVNSGLVIVPHNYSPARKYPLIVDLHGGPDGGVPMSGSLLLQNSLEWQMWAARGFIVLAADYRSSEIAGWNTYVRAVRSSGPPLSYDFEDIMAGLDYTIAHYAVDTHRLVLDGHSNGGIETNWILTHTHRFRVAVSYEGDADQYIAWSSGFRIGGNPAETWEYNGTPIQVPQHYLADSAAMFVKGVTTPTLFISGEDGIALFHNEFLYGAWLSQHVPVQYVIYGGEGHVVSAPANLKDLLWRAIHWIDKYNQ